MSIKQFTQTENIKMLWDVISDEDIFRFLSPDIQSKIHELFLNNIVGFFEVEKMKINSLVDLNKKYILLIHNHIKQNYLHQQSKIKIHNEPIKELITYEDIQTERKSHFDRDFVKRQEEFENSMKIKTPQVPDFSDKRSDSPIKEMDKILAEMRTQRNYEVEQINKKHPSRELNEMGDWLKPQETSLKSEKIKFNETINNTEDNKNNRFITLEGGENISPTSSKKTVSWSNDTINNSNDNYNDEEDENIFSKLKKVQNTNVVNNNGYVSESRINTIESQVKILNEKMDMIINMLNRNSN